MVSSFAILLIVIAGGVIIGCLAWVVHLNLRARRLGLPSPSLIAYFRPPSSNPVYQNSVTRSTARASHHPPQKSGFLGIFGKKKANSRGEFGLVGSNEDDGAWDSRGYYEEDTEMGLRVDTHAARNNYPQRTSNIDTPGTGPRSGRWNGTSPEDDSPPRGRSRSRSPRPGYNVAANRGPQSGGMKTSPKTKNDPFGDEHGVRRSTDTGRSSVFTEEAF
ncbi:hypothetical protein H072_2453 [Dactylellina haptotyla CBS 200.50]|uniref:Uncharacterized protein n=1 Tax=Dactylellina haptotyla (strain CBS 200.50) TaxID=1284197 RepID=S8AL65_DACHA|nr:hypothetical protein H072_2453 [Dactylellina haptotyla CBS 200.50]